jgi:methionine-gamma-lyase
MPHKRFSGPSTRCVHGGRGKHLHAGLAPPIFPASVYAFDNLEDAVSTFLKQREGLIYARYGHPTGLEVESRLAALQETQAAALCSSGMAAIGLTLLTFCRSGDHVLSSAEMYGGTAELLTTIAPAAGLEVEFVQVSELGDLGPRLRKNTRLVLLESPTNPLARLVDFEALFNGLGDPDPRPFLVLDATLATPLGQDSVGAGFDLIVHSGTKYMGGHDDLIAGAVMGNAELVEAVRERRRILGANCDPQSAWLLDRGLKTLAVRWDRQCANALSLAREIENHDRVVEVHYPGLPSHPHHELAKRQMHAFGALLAFEVEGGLQAATHVFNRLGLIARAPSLGGVDSMVLHPTTSSHRTLSPEERDAAGIRDGLIRMSVGIEDAEDLWADLKQALDA